MLKYRFKYLHPKHFRTTTSLNQRTSIPHRCGQHRYSIVQLAFDPTGGAEEDPGQISLDAFLSCVNFPCCHLKKQLPNGKCLIKHVPVSSKGHERLFHLVSSFVINNVRFTTESLETTGHKGRLRSQANQRRITVVSYGYAFENVLWSISDKERCWQHDSSQEKTID